jgi:hypothetical protein
MQRTAGPSASGAIIVDENGNESPPFNYAGGGYTYFYGINESGIVVDVIGPIRARQMDLSGIQAEHRRPSTIREPQKPVRWVLTIPARLSGIMWMAQVPGKRL